MNQFPEREAQDLVIRTEVEGTKEFRNHVLNFFNDKQIKSYKKKMGYCNKIWRFSKSYFFLFNPIEINFKPLTNDGILTQNVDNSTILSEEEEEKSTLNMNLWIYQWKGNQGTSICGRKCRFFF